VLITMCYNAKLLPTVLLSNPESLCPQISVTLAALADRCCPVGAGRTAGKTAFAQVPAWPQYNAFEMPACQLARQN
jgi:hypothetical protein